MPDEFVVWKRCEVRRLMRETAHSRSRRDLPKCITQGVTVEGSGLAACSEYRGKWYVVNHMATGYEVMAGFPRLGDAKAALLELLEISVDWNTKDGAVLRTVLGPDGRKRTREIRKKYSRG